MSWQDELRQLDGELAAGRVSPEDYRRRRDELLAQSANPYGSPLPPEAQPQQPPQQPQQQPPQSGPGPWTPAGGQPYPQQPYPQQGYPGYGSAGQYGQPPKQPPQPQPPQANAAERTQMMGPVTAGPSDPTQAVRPANGGNGGANGGNGGGNGGNGGGNGGNGDPERTQTVSGIGTAQPPYQADQGGWGMDPAAGSGELPPWAGSEFPPLTTSRPNEPWYSKGGQGFDAGGGNRTRLFAIIGVVVLVAVIVVALVVFKPFSHGGGNNQAGPSTTVPRPTPTTPTGPIASIPGVSVPNDIHTFPDVVALNFLTSGETELYQSAGPIRNVYFALVHDGQNKIVILVVEKPSAAAAKQIAGQLAQLQVAYKMTGRIGGPVGVFIQAADQVQGGPLRRAEYASGDDVVYVEVQGPSANGADQEMTSVLEAQLASLPAQ